MKFFLILIFAAALDARAGELEDLRDPDPRVRARAVEAIAASGAQDRARQVALLNATADRHGMVRDRALAALAKLGIHDAVQVELALSGDDVKPLLAEKITRLAPDDPRTVRRLAVGLAGPQAEEAAGVIERIKKPDPALTLAAAKRLGAGYNTSRPLFAYLARVQSEDPAVTSALIAEYATAGPTVSPIIDRALGVEKRSAEHWVEWVKARPADVPRPLAQGMLALLARTGGNSPDAAREITKLLEGPAGTNPWTLRLLTKASRIEPALLEKIITLAQSEDSGYREVAMMNLGRFGRGNLRAVRAIAAGVGDFNELVRNAATQGLADLGYSGKARADLAFDHEWAPSKTAMGSRIRLALAAPTDARTLKLLGDVIRDPKCPEHLTVLEGVTKLGTVDRALGAPLAEALNMGDPYFRRVATTALARIVTPDDDTKRAVIRAREDADAEVRRGIDSTLHRWATPATERLAYALALPETPARATNIAFDALAAGSRDARALRILGEVVKNGPPDELYLAMDKYAPAEIVPTLVEKLGETHFMVDGKRGIAILRALQTADSRDPLVIDAMVAACGAGEASIRAEAEKILVQWLGPEGVTDAIFLRENKISERALVHLLPYVAKHPRGDRSRARWLLRRLLDHGSPETLVRTLPVLEHCMDGFLTWQGRVTDDIVEGVQRIARGPNPPFLTQTVAEKMAAVNSARMPCGPRWRFF